MTEIKKSVSDQFAKVYGTPGEAPRLMGLLRGFWPLLLIAFVLGYLLRAAFSVPALSSVQIGFLLVLFAVGSGLLLARGARRFKNFQKGAKGEEWVAHELAFLSSEYTIFNGFQFSNGAHGFDHIVLGPAGIFVVETKNWKGSVEFHDGKLFFEEGKEPSRSPLEQVKGAALELTSFLDGLGENEVHVQSVLCFVSTELPEDFMNINGVFVCSGARLFDVVQDAVVADPLPMASLHKITDALKQEIDA